jgi:ATP-dependent DNA helicase RecG
LKQNTQFTLPALSTLKGMTPRVKENLAKCNIHTVQDLFFHLPSRYENRTCITPIAELRLGDHAVIQAQVDFADVSRGRKKMLICRLHDNTGHLTLRFFHFSLKQFESFKSGTLLRCFGEVRGWSGELEMVHPEYQFVSPATPLPVEECLTPVYPTTEGLQQRSLRQLTDSALRFLKVDDGDQFHFLPDYLPSELLTELQLPALTNALQYVHRPPKDAQVEILLQGKHPTQQRLAFEELLAHHLSLRLLRSKTQQNFAPALKKTGAFIERFLTNLSFGLTGAQQRVVNEIANDIEKSQPMLRLLQGDVGSGKTVVAALAALQAVENNYQAVLMAPTELLAEQHYRNFSAWLEPLGIPLIWLSGKFKGKTREEKLATIAQERAAIIVGTHALFQEDVRFANLGLIIVDEQHRFGVHQRLSLREKGAKEGLFPHQLIMTATPIPRTLAMTVYADLDTSIIDELPPGRTPIKTVVIPDKRRDEIIQHVKNACETQRQVYWVCPLIEDSEVLQCQAAESTAEKLKLILPGLKIGLVHGRMNAQQKETAMTAFKARETDLLVATTVIEVGVDVPNASLMVIENAERLGLAQLHQLRGRVGRGSLESFCVLLYQYPLSAIAKERLAVMRDTHDGFVIARRDLEIRGPGEVLGTKQAGMLRLRIADLLRDAALLPKVQQAAEILFRDYPQFIEPLIQRWLATAERFAEV